MYIHGQQNNNIPPWFNELPPDDEIWRIGDAYLVNNRHSMNLAEIKARAHIISQIHIRIISRANDDEFKNLVNSLINLITIQASFEIINDTRILRQWVSPDGVSWCLIAIKKSDVRKYTSIIANIFDEYFDSIFGSGMDVNYQYEHYIHYGH
ncbi:MAG: hypothetical protein FWD14_07985 [Treponema sp.]|nr:hypothetical protein [Treponema sp.]